MALVYDVSLSGLELMRQIDELSRAPDHDEPIPILDANTEIGRTRFKARLDHRHLNPFGVVHGGFTCGLLDSAAGMAAHSTLPPRSWIATVDLNVKFLRTIKADTDLIVEGRVSYQSRQVVVADSSIKDSGDRILATGSGIFIVKDLN